MKRKAEKQQAAAPVSALSAVAARRARQQQAQAAPIPKTEVVVEIPVGPPTKKPKFSDDESNSLEDAKESKAHRTRSSRKIETTPSLPPKHGRQEQSQPPERPKSRLPSSVGSREDRQEDAASQNHLMDSDGIAEDEVTSVLGDADGFEAPTEIPPELHNFPLSKARLNKDNVAYADKDKICVRVKEKMNLALVGQYDLWVKKGVISLMGAKLHPCARAYRVYAPSTHSLPVIKCVSGSNGEAEVEIKSCKSGLTRLHEISPLYQKIWNGKVTAADKMTLKGKLKNSRRTFSVLYTSADDSFKRHLRPLHLDKKWSASMKALSHKQGQLRVLVCGPKASGKSTFSRYLLNHVLSPAPEVENGFVNSDGCAFLDLDPGQPEFATMGQVYLAHLRAPFFGPPFTHPSLDDTEDGQILRAHFIGATSPKEDPDHYALAVMDLMEQYRLLLTKYPQCPLIVNYPGWIFGQGLEVATWLVRSLGLSDVVYMSEKGPAEVIEPLGGAAIEARVALTILPSQPTDFVSRSSAQLRAMQIQSYFHMSHYGGLVNPLWQAMPLSRTRPITVKYAGSTSGILGVMVLGAHIEPSMLREVLEGAVVGVVAVESTKALAGSVSSNRESQNTDDETMDQDLDMDDEKDLRSNADDAPRPANGDLANGIVRVPEDNLPYLYSGAGTSVPLNPSSSSCLGLALIRAVNVTSHQLELSTPIPASRLEKAFEEGHQLVLVRGQIDNPNWAISEEYYAARAAERRYQKEGRIDGVDTEKHQKTLAILHERVRRASNVPWMTVVEDNSRRHREAAARREHSLWKLRKKAYAESESEAEY
ncbi:Uncharacterized protein PECH_008839 [Penicillium ucsense]|uniref:Polynucleotide 5'-hydroxyl-kinase GRC3 n=1 Tax=Penicillium ucsense TaxID=2839758 RepID=A0A8J8W839_9EURO|nr:Uncharacterized protein PECM_001506 [Penicillium ucsense]KAF7733901.1 Uncharacterized protein PECH_008839 [Penicillium ucsense]